MKKSTKTQIIKSIKENGNFVCEYNQFTKALYIQGKCNGCQIAGVDMPYLMELLEGHVWTIGSYPWMLASNNPMKVATIVVD